MTPDLMRHSYFVSQSNTTGTEMRIWIVPAFISYFAGNDCYKGIIIYEFKLHVISQG